MTYPDGKLFGPVPMPPTDVRNDARDISMLHDFEPDDSGLSCLTCHLPLDNWRHRTASRLRHLIARKIEAMRQDIEDLQSLNDQLTYVLLKQKP